MDQTTGQSDPSNEVKETTRYSVIENKTRKTKPWMGKEKESGNCYRE